MARRPSVSSSQRFPVLSGTLASSQLNFTLQWMARQSKEEKIVIRIRNLHFKAFLHGLIGTAVHRQASSAVISSKAASMRD